MRASFFIATTTCREWTEDGQLWVQYVSATPATRLDVINTQEHLDQRLLARQARETGICPVREELYGQCFGAPRRPPPGRAAAAWVGGPAHCMHHCCCAHYQYAPIVYTTDSANGPFTYLYPYPYPYSHR